MSSESSSPVDTTAEYRIGRKLYEVKVVMVHHTADETYNTIVLPNGAHKKVPYLSLTHTNGNKNRQYRVKHADGSLTYHKNRPTKTKPDDQVGKWGQHRTTHLWDFVPEPNPSPPVRPA